MMKWPTDTEILDWLSKNEVIQQEVGSDGWTLPEKDFRQAIRATMQREWLASTVNSDSPDSKKAEQTED